MKTLGDRMKQCYEQPFYSRLPARLPVIIRIDGKNFHTFTRGMEKPFDDTFIEAMERVTAQLAKEIPTTCLAYTQSDEISILLHPYKELDSEPWFNNEVQKIVSVSASIASFHFSRIFPDKSKGYFDSRVFVLPESEVANYFIWRQQDAERNSLNTLAQAHFSHKQLHGLKRPQLHDMLYFVGVNWNDLPTHKKRGFCALSQGIIDKEIPIFTEDRNYIERFFL